MVVGGGQTAGRYDQHDDRTLDQVSKDADITQEVQRLLSQYKTVNADTKNGVVFLQGTAKSKYEVTSIINQIYMIEGVQKVVSYLRIKSPNKINH